MQKKNKFPVSSPFKEKIKRQEDAILVTEKKNL